MTGPGPALWATSATLILFGITWRITQAVLWILDGHRSR